MRHGLPQHADARDALARERALAEQQALYEWQHLPGVPAFCRGLPEPERPSRWDKDRAMWDLLGSGREATIGVLRRFNYNVTTLRRFDTYYAWRRKPGVARDGRWRTDEEFARQRLDGVNPFLIRRIDEIPEHFPVTDDLVAGVLPAGTRIADLLAAGRLFLVDYDALDGCPFRAGRFGCAPMGLFWVDESPKLMPLAIQLGQSPAEAKVIFTPANDPWTWLIARTHFQSADAAYHEVVAHLFRTHLVMEPLWVAASRTLPAHHPVHELLKAHFNGTIHINHSARAVMIAPAGPIDQAISVGSEGSYWLIAQELRRWTFDDTHPLLDLEVRGVADPAVLPGYHYRDDAILLWHAIDEYVGKLLRIFYADDDTSVHDDTEVQAWAREMSDPAAGGVRGLPLTATGGFATVDDLRRTVAQIVFCCSVEHAAVNNGQYDIFGYIPNAPGAMWTPPPRRTDPSSEEEFVGTMPLPAAIAQQLALVHLLSAPTTTPLGSYDRQFFNKDPEVRSVVDGFRHDRDRIADTIHGRNNGLDVPYRYLDPHSVGRSIAI